jgi:hypothetical protein
MLHFALNERDFLGREIEESKNAVIDFAFGIQQCHARSA